MNKTKRVAWHKHLKSIKRRKEHARAAKGAGATGPQRPAVASRPVVKR
ncbi:MAG: hypothetical protein KGO05_10400 [Chloroflexota bacterium]|nr:hypothetical protein [Chloroflexota bacterium]